MLAKDLRGLGRGGLVDELESVLVLSSHELILLVGNSLLVGLQVGIRGSLGSGGSGQISVLSSGNKLLGLSVIESLQGCIQGSLLGLDGGGMSSLSTLESCSILVASGGELGSSSSLGLTSFIIGLLGGSLLVLSGLEVSGSGGGGLGGTVESLGLGDVVSLGLVEGWDIEVVWETLVAPFALAVILEEDGIGASDEESSDGEFHFYYYINLI